MKIQATNKNDEVSDLEEETGGFSDNFVSFVSSDELKEIILQQVGDCPGIESTRIYHSLSNMASQSVFDSFLRELVVDGILIEHQKFEKHQGRFRQNPGYFLSKQHLDSKLHFKLIDNFQYSKLIQQHTIPLEKFTTKTPYCEHKQFWKKLFENPSETVNTSKGEQIQNNSGRALVETIEKPIKNENRASVFSSHSMLTRSQKRKRESQETEKQQIQTIPSC